MRNLPRLLCIAVLGLIAGAPGAEAATVARVVDGDTIRVKAGGRTVTVNLLGVRAASACGADGGATLAALLPRRAKVRLVRDRRAGAAYVFRGRRFVNREMLQRGAATAVRLRGLRRASALGAAERVARERRVGVWSCAGASEPAVPGPLAGSPFGGGDSPPAGPAAPDPETPRPPPPPPTDPAVDTPENRSEIDAYIRGHRFTMSDEMEGDRIEQVVQFCEDGRLLVRMSMTGWGERSAQGTWKLLGVARRDDQMFLGALEVTLPGEEGDETDQISVGHLTDGTAVFADESDHMPVTRAPADGC